MLVALEEHKYITIVTNGFIPLLRVIDHRLKDFSRSNRRPELLVYTAASLRQSDCLIFDRSVLKL